MPGLTLLMPGLASLMPGLMSLMPGLMSLMPDLASLICDPLWRLVQIRFWILGFCNEVMFERCFRAFFELKSG